MQLIPQTNVTGTVTPKPTTGELFNDGSELVPLPFPSPDPAPEPETNLTASAVLLIAAPPTPQAQLDAIKDAFKANKDEGAVIAKSTVFKGNVDDVARFLPMFRNWATEQKTLRIKAGQGVTPEDVGKLDHRRTIQSTLSFCEGGKASRWAANYLKQMNTSMTNETINSISRASNMRGTTDCYT
ncbi:hypothetical protein PQX77_021697 [Marasmius sp. AFHP31]|nr:hypothetical protein PQX77_021697 [Marasmius sp. AFHP31]